MIEKLDPVSSEPKFRSRPNYPDILALQARVQQLEAAMRRVADELLTYDKPRTDRLANKLEMAISTPALPVSPLWGILAAVGAFNESFKGEIPDEAKERLYGTKLLMSWRNLTPELRALIEEMAKGGQE